MSYDLKRRKNIININLGRGKLIKDLVLDVYAVGIVHFPCSPLLLPMVWLGANFGEQTCKEQT